MNNNEEKFVFELKDLSFSDLVSLYSDILDFNTYLDNTFKSVSEETIAPVEEIPTEDAGGEETLSEENKTEDASNTENITEAGSENDSSDEKSGTDNNSTESSNDSESTNENKEENV